MPELLRRSLTSCLERRPAVFLFVCVFLVCFRTERLKASKDGKDVTEKSWHLMRFPGPHTDASYSFFCFCFYKYSHFNCRIFGFMQCFAVLPIAFASNVIAANVESEFCTFMLKSLFSFFLFFCFADSVFLSSSLPITGFCVSAPLSSPGCSSVCGSSTSSSCGPADPSDPSDWLCGQNAGEQ